MGSVLERLRSRPRQRREVVLARPEAAPAREALARAAVALAEARAAGSPGALAQATAAHDEAMAASREAPEPDVIVLEALPPGEFEALRHAHTDPASGDLDTAGLRPELLAACAVDEELRDPDVWRELAEGTALTDGDVQTLYLAAYRLNGDFGQVRDPAALGKG